MAKIKIMREVTDRDINRLENLVVAYNTMFLVSSLFIVLIASTTRELFSDFNRILSPSLALLIVGCFIVLLAVLGYIGVDKKSSSIMSLYTMLLIFIFVMEMSAGLGILSFRRDIETIVGSKMKKTITAYRTDLMTANSIDYVQLKLECCGVNSFKDWDGILEPTYPTYCKMTDFNLPVSCCIQPGNGTLPVVIRRGCMPAVNFMLHRSSLSLTFAVIAICTIQILGAYFSYALATSLSKYKIQKAATTENQRPPPYELGTPVNYNEKSFYF